ncbi:MAG: class I SAM-dependent DNA methyltransferase [Nitrososphaeria archaeon]
MEKSLPPWLERRYNVLWESFGDKPFRFGDAAKILMDRCKDVWEQVPTVVSELRKAGYLFVESDPKDARQKIYRLKSLVLYDRGDIESLLKRAADLIRTRVDYRFILVLLFLKRISDKWEAEYKDAFEEALEDGFSEEEAREEAKRSEYHLFNLPEEFLWKNIRKDVSSLTEKLSSALKRIGELNPDLKIVFDNVEFTQFTSSRENAEILRQLVELFSEKRLDSVSADVLGEAYEWILRYFAPEKAKEGEIYTPREVIRLLVEMLDPKPLESVYDPCCGSGGMLIYSFKHVEEKFNRSEAEKLFLYGQEVNPSILALAKMNMYIHDIYNHRLEGGDTLLYPKFKKGESIEKFDVVIANPPWNQDGYDEEVLKKGEFWRERFSFGFTSRQSADWAWIQHMLASAKPDTGRVGVVIDNGCLFRGGKEKAVRSAILERDLVECVILLPEKLFYNTGAPGAIIVFNKNKPESRKGKILFINASNEYIQHPTVRKLNTLSDENIRRIAEAYHSFKEEQGFTRIVSLEEVRNNDYNLNVTLYVMIEEKEEQIDILKEWMELKELEKEKQEITSKLEEYISQITQAIGEQA